MTDVENLSIFIKKIALEQEYPTDNDNIKITPISSGGANYSSKLYLVTLTGEGKDDLKLFAKVAVMNEAMREQMPLDLYDTERRMYTKLLKVYRDLEAQHGVPEEHTLKFPKYYGADVKRMEETLVLEDLTSRGFGSANRFKSVDWQYAAAAITELAKFHALSFAYQHYYPSQFDQFINTLPCGLVNEDEQTKSVFQNAVKSALTAVRDENKEKLNKFLESRNVGAYTAMFKPLKREVLIHTDFRPNNMLHKTTDNGTTEVIPVDYQTAQKGSPVIDLLYFIFTATDGQFRAKYYQKLVDHYHSQLVTALARFGLNADEKYSKEDLEFEMKEKLSFGLQLSIIALPLLTIPEDEAPQLESSMDLSSMVDVFGTTSDLYTKRLNDVVDNYVEWGILK